MPIHLPNSVIRRAGILVMSVSLMLPSAVTAHDGETDVGFADLRATQADGIAVVEVQISQADDCTRFEARQLRGQRGDAVVTGVLEPAALCQFRGEIALSGAGRWLVFIQLAYDGKPAEVEMPIGVSETKQAFTRVDWVHLVPQQPAFWEEPSALTLGAVGVAIGVMIEVARRRWLRHRSHESAMTSR